MRDPTDLRGEELQAEHDEAQAQSEIRRQADDLKWMLAHKQGRRIAWQLLSEAGVFRNPWSTDTSAMAFNCGSMNIGQQFLARIQEHSPDAWLLMLRESKEQ